MENGEWRCGEMFCLAYSDGIAVYDRFCKVVLFFHGSSCVSEEMISQIFLEERVLRVNDEPRRRDEYRAPNVEILLTEKCQLCCNYCFSDAEPKKRTMTRERAFSAIDLAFRNAWLDRRLFGESDRCVRIGFTGGGEPTYESGLLVECFDYIREKSFRMGLGSAVSLQTNGQCDISLLEKLLSLKSYSMTLSMDGIPLVQNSQRKRRDLGDSFKRCEDVLRFAGAYGVPLVVRATATAFSLPALSDFASYLDGEFPFVGRLFVDTLSLRGRASGQRENRPSVEDFCASMEKIRKLNLRNLIVTNHVADLRRHTYYCGSYSLRNSVYVSPGAHISFCQENLEPSDSCDENNHIAGTYNGDYPVLRADSPSGGRWAMACKSPDCSACIALYFCAGGCLSKISFSENGRVVGDESRYWCTLTRLLARMEIHDCVFDHRLYPDAERTHWVAHPLSKSEVTMVQIRGY